jgi:preprotein translocase subunit SecG
MYAFIIAVHVIVSIFLIFVILLQPAKSDGMGAVGGGGGSNSSSVFGGRGSVTFLSKVTTVCAIIFMVTSLTLAWRSSHSSSVLQARRNLAAQDSQKKNESSGPLSTPLPTGQTAPAPVTGGAAIPAQGSGTPNGNETPSTPAPAATKGPGAPTAPPTPAKKK